MDAEARARIIEEERLRQSLQSKSKPFGLILTFFFPVLGFLYTTNYIWAIIFLIFDVINFFLAFAFGIGIFGGLLVRIIALFIANHGINRHREKKLRALERDVEATRPPLPDTSQS